MIVGGLATVLHGYPQFTADIDQVINLKQQEAEIAIKLITSLGLQARLPVKSDGFYCQVNTDSWIENKNRLVVMFYEPENPVLVVDIFMREPMPFAEL